MNALPRGAAVHVRSLKSGPAAAAARAVGDRGLPRRPGPRLSEVARGAVTVRPWTRRGSHGCHCRGRRAARRTTAPVKPAEDSASHVLHDVWLDAHHQDRSLRNPDDRAVRTTTPANALTLRACHIDPLHFFRKACHLPLSGPARPSCVRSLATCGHSALSTVLNRS
eukprot:COSAG06_NODE_28377_length_575_cov_1.338235_1_plen_166_part_10